MQSKKSKSRATTISRQSNQPRLLLLLMAILLCSSLPACQSAPPCPVCPDTRITLQVEQAPPLREIQAVKRGSEYCFPERGRKDMLVDLEMLRAWGASNQAVIEGFNRRSGEGDKH